MAAMTEGSAEKGLRFLLRFNGVLAIGTIFSVLMPHAWLVWCVRQVDPEINVRLLVVYLARALSVFYLLLGLLLVLFAADVRRYRRAITVIMWWTLFAAASMLVQAAPFVRDFQGSWFFWVMLGDGVYGLVTAVGILWLQRQVPSAEDKLTTG